jgi:diadenosine tetraphosphate (Ap4A) HIT family hydrolase
MLQTIQYQSNKAQQVELHNDKCKYCNCLTEENSIKEKKLCNTILYESNNFVVMPTLGSMVEGWLLIVPRKHFINMGAIPFYLEDEFKEVVTLTKKVLIESYGAITIFEHGPITEGTGVGCGIDHAHFHLVPLAFSLLNEAKKSKELIGLRWEKCQNDFVQLTKLHKQQNAYLYINEPEHESSYCILNEIPCQSLRRIIAHKLGMEEKYDYKKYAFESNIAKTIKKLESVFRN